MISIAIVPITAILSLSIYRGRKFRYCPTLLTIRVDSYSSLAYNYSMVVYVVEFVVYK